MKNDVFTDMLPAHVRYGYGSLKIDEAVEIPVQNQSEAAKIRGGVGAYGQYYNKKYKTAVKNGFIFIKRIS